MNRSFKQNSSMTTSPNLTTERTFQGEEAWKIDAPGAFEHESSSEFQAPEFDGSPLPTWTRNNIMPKASSSDPSKNSPVKLMASKFGNQCSWAGKKPSYTDASPMKRLGLFSSPSKPQNEKGEDEVSTTSSSGLSTSDNAPIEEAEATSAPVVIEEDDDSETEEVEYGEEPETKIPKSYNVWEFGKKKRFTPPASNAKTNCAAIQIQRIARGGWQRLKFRVVLLQHKLDTRDEITEIALDKVWDDLEDRKSKFFEIMKGKADRKNSKYLTQVKTVNQEGQNIITYLRKENRKMRTKNEKMIENMIAMKHENDSLENTQKLIQKNIAELNEHIQRFQETHDQLQEALPLLETRFNEMKELDQHRRLVCGSEHKTKIMYMKVVTDIVEAMETRGRQQKLIDEIVGFCLTVDENEANCED